jgi:hypothetical protein
MSGFFQNLLKDAAGAFFGSDYLRDYTHASKTFRPNAYQNAPKLKFLFHVYFKINADAYQSSQQNFGILVKDVKLPSFTMKTHQLNQYNRKRIVQTKIQYDPVTINFHDDNGNAINTLWRNYYKYYFADGAKISEFGGQPPADASQGATEAYGSSTDQNEYKIKNLYKPSISGNTDWGYVGETSQTTGGGLGKKPFFDSITIYGFHQKNYIAYTLVNPIITNFSHDTYSYAESSGIMQNSMTLDYEYVLYGNDALDGNNPGEKVFLFGDQANYDRALSPIAMPGSNATILGQGGLVDAATGALDDLAKGNLLGAVKKAGTAYNTFKNTDVKSVAKTELLGMLQNSLQNAPNTRNTRFDIPVAGSTPGPLGTAGSPTIDAKSAPSSIDDLTGVTPTGRINAQPKPAGGQVTNGNGGR